MHDDLFLCDFPESSLLFCLHRNAFWKRFSFCLFLMQQLTTVYPMLMH